MSDIFFDELNIPKPAYNLGISGVGHGAMTGRMLEGLEQVFLKEKPDWVLVFGDINSTIAGALAASKLHIPIAHVEAGLRSFNRKMPEEINRILTDHCADLLFTPTAAATQNLNDEGIAAGKISEVGDVMQDAAILFGDLAKNRETIAERLELVAGQFILATVHRQENTDHPDRLAAIVEGLCLIASEIPVILPLHPRTRARVDAQGIKPGRGVRIIEPIGFIDMIALERASALVVTDSGGVQKEAYFQRVHCVTLRDETEWTELVASGWNKLCPPTSGKAIADAVCAAIGTVGQDNALYGTGNASQRIAHQMSAMS
ncbi:non-hydrolyzing UDP-N-acetylglucosamine 2-epimerase [Roseobacter litoralis]|uniref:non-hydrolyzing UDP-N-acetylglucosamine 2-epimerase n=1 Tax=Roseobacter litoralis TaxID=42443 RepID=UPI0024943DB8|nr:UDP-N-acetylglucosamine 2-epimerase (non-hydrolyzing) [Roseobacter litoralis]